MGCSTCLVALIKLILEKAEMYFDAVYIFKTLKVYSINPSSEWLTMWLGYGQQSKGNIFDEVSMPIPFVIFHWKMCQNDKQVE